jgi:hypothetical protein
MLACMKELEEENRRLPKMYADAQLGAVSLARDPRKQIVGPSQRRELAQRAVQSQRTTIRHACATFALNEPCYRYVAKHTNENAVIAD